MKIVQKCIEGNTNAFEHIVDKYQKPIFNGAYRMIHQYEDAEDVTQSVFIKAFENLRYFDPKYKFFSWLYRILVNESLNFINQRKRFTRYDSDILVKGATLKKDQSLIELHQDLQNALMDLKPDYRVLIVMKHFQDFSYKEMSDVLDVPEKTVKSRLFTARQLLKDILSKRGYVENAG
ncbi:MAG: RNA polymerase sigma factor [Gemmatimonadota bacterium]|nr:MAG: RNA polymerase sigma factor [Gemmatimonadota bacterium]